MRPRNENGGHDLGDTTGSDATGTTPGVSTKVIRGTRQLMRPLANVVLRDGHPILLDFGAARPIGSLQHAGFPVGTDGYIAPEQEACEPITVAMDLYGLGMVLAEAVTGVPRAEGAEIPPSPLAPLIQQLRSEQPAERGTTGDILIALAETAGELLRPWPAWLDRYASDFQPVP
jgi:serine/threonine protein kinase